MSSSSACPSRPNIEDPHAIQPEDALIRVVKGVEDSVDMVVELSARFDYGRSVP